VTIEVASPEAWLERWKQIYGPTIVTYRNIAADPERVAALDEALLDVARKFDRGGATTVLDWEYLILTARVPSCHPAERGGPPAAAALSTVHRRRTTVHGMVGTGAQPHPVARVHLGHNITTGHRSARPTASPCDHSTARFPNHRSRA
jgi:hypothetical protein